ncbi:hypothetical protein [Labilibaculum antarcticum]|uniref:Iota-carrageenase n=1 Tax=Labilibaculum antarcticum TaxID=1717717 RepID=A0A1Y1CIP2_9BACT|nr:hypothetical protein [Labilibaculum antarcticum]BAX80268.1 hypothetical protein ALGA_1909 [Labilibaculum antarcticum]
MRVLLLLLLLISTSCFGQIQEDDSFYFNPDEGKGFAEIEATDVNYSKGEAVNNLIQKEINKLTTSGGVLKIKSGTYKVEGGIVFKSNVHIKVEAGVVFELDGTGTIFSAQSGSEKPLTNFSLQGLGTDNRISGCTDDRFVIKFKYDNKSANTKKSAVIRIGNATNFKLSNFIIIDQYTQPSSIVLSPEFSTVSIFPGAKGDQKANKTAARSNLINKVYGAPNKGIIENIDNLNGAFGYGLVQMQAGKNIIYRNLEGTGGIIVRLESGLNIIQLFRPIGSAPIYKRGGIDLPLTIDNQPKIDLVYLDNISCKDGHSAFSMSPHTIDQGRVFIKNIHVEGCQDAGYVGDGFINNFKREEAAGLDVAAFGITPGSFSGESTVENVTAIFGQNAQIKSKNFPYIPCELRIDKGADPTDPEKGLAVDISLDFESYRGPSLHSIKNGNTTGIKISNVKAIGFPSSIPPDGVVSPSFKNNFTDCESIGTFSKEINPRGGHKKK